MNKLLTLVNLELKRSKRFFIPYLALFSFLTLALNIFQMFRFEDRTNIINDIKDSFGGVSYGMAILNYNTGLSMIVVVSLVGILVYSVFMWVREYKGDTKSIYTLIMIPENKYIIYLSKMISVITMVYSMLISQIAMIYISKFVFNAKFKYVGVINGSLKDDLSYGRDLLINAIPTNMIDFFMIYVVFLVLVISVIFTVCVIGMSFKEDNVGIFYISMITAFLAPELINIRLSARLYALMGSMNIGYLGVDLILNILTIIVLNAVSLKLMNKRLYI
ncbi:MAG: hypothetical protein ACRDD7_04495 [Peptostreptococcaceae bacterium]